MVAVAVIIAALGTIGYQALKQEMGDPKVARANQNQINRYDADANGCWWRIGSDGITRYTCTDDPKQWAGR